MNIEAQHYAVWRSFNQYVYMKTLTPEDVTHKGNEFYLDEVTEIRKRSTGKYDALAGRAVETKCIFMEKNGIKYILPSMYEKYLPLNVNKSFDCYLKSSDKTIYKFIEDPMSVKISPEKFMELKDLLHVFNPLEHSNPKVWLFLKLQSIASKAKGCKYRLCSPPSTGKNANDIILNMITNDNVRVSKPTIAKLETLFYYNQKVLPDEMTSLTPQQIREVEPFFLTIADESPTFQKHSMATKKDMNNVDISQSSCVFTYNDPQSLVKGSKFFDDIWQNHAAFASRYPALLLNGEILTEMPKLSQKQADLIMNSNFDGLRKIAKTIMYYIQYMSQELHNYDRSGCILRGRHKSNFEGVLDAIDVVSQSQQEFNDWIMWINDRVTSYRNMNKPEAVEIIDMV